MTQQVKTQTRYWLIPALESRPKMRGADLFFHILMLFHRPDTWPALMIAASLLLWAGVTYGLWRLTAPNTAIIVSLGLFAFTLADWSLLKWLPRAGRSFGPVNPQLSIMLLPRLAVTFAAAALAHYSHPTWGMITFFGLQAAGSLAYIWGLAVEPMRLSMTDLAVTSPHLAPDAQPIRLLHLSDFHLERLSQRETAVLNFIERANPDLIVITGDYLNASNRCDPIAVTQVRRLLSQIHAPHGVYAVLGTPSVDLPYIAPLHFQETDIQLLRRSVAEVDFGDGRRLALLGLDCTHDVDHDADLLSRLIEVAPDGIPRLFLYHSPELMPVAAHHALDLYLCGHTHGGQVRIPGFGALFTSAATGKRYEMGRYDERGTTLYVSRGIGLEGLSMPRMRLFCPPEITLVTISAKHN